MNVVGGKLCTSGRPDCFGSSKSMGVELVPSVAL